MAKRTLLVLAFLFAVATGAFAQKKNTALVKITRVEGNPIELAFNPTELAIDKSVPWQKHKNVEGDAPDLEFTSAEGRSMSFELVFDTFEARQDVYVKFVKPIEDLTLIDSSLKRPPMVKVSWSPNVSFGGVIESVSTKYTLFLPDGTPCRATTTIHVRETSRATSSSDDPNK